NGLPEGPALVDQRNPIGSIAGGGANERERPLVPARAMTGLRVRVGGAFTRSEERNVRRIGIFGWGIVAPRSPNIEAFERNLEASESWLSPFKGFGKSNFLVGAPDFRFADY